MLLVQLRSWVGPHLGLEMRATIVLFGTRMDCAWGAETPTGPGPWRGTAPPPPPPQADWLPSKGADSGRKGVGPAQTTGDVHPSQHRALRDVAAGAPLPGGGWGSHVGEDEPQSPMQPRNLFGADSEDTASEDTSSADSEHDSDGAAPGVEINISAEGTADNTYMLTIRLLSLLAMLVATSRWLQVTGHEVNAKKSLAFSAASKARRKPEALEATLDGVQMPVQRSPTARDRSPHGAAEGNRPTAPAPHRRGQKSVEENPHHSRGL